jgi:hypothetical protein
MAHSVQRRNVVALEERNTMNIANTRRAAVLICVAVIGACATPASKKPPAEWDGLARREVKGLDNVYVRPNVEIPAYKTVMIDPVQVEFSKDWEPNDNQRDISRHLDAEDLQKIKTEVGRLFRESFSDELAKGGYPLIEQPQDDTMRVLPAIINLYINAPDTMSAGRSRTYTTEAGRMTLVMEIRDGPTGQLLARVVDARTAGGMGGYMTWTNSTTNRADAQREFDDWAKRLRNALDRLNGKGKT